MSTHAKVFNICLRTKVPITDIYRGLPVIIISLNSCARTVI